MAFVRIGQFTALPDTTERLRAIYETEAIPAIRAATGNISAVLLQQHHARRVHGNHRMEHSRGRGAL